MFVDVLIMRILLFECVGLGSPSVSADQSLLSSLYNRLVKGSRVWETCVISCIERIRQEVNLDHERSYIASDSALSRTRVSTGGFRFGRRDRLCS